MNRKEFDTSIGLVTIILVSVFVKKTMPFLFLEKHSTPIQYTTSIIDTTSIDATTNVGDWQATAIRKRKPYGRGWLDAYERGVIYNYRPKWDENNINKIQEDSTQ